MSDSGDYIDPEGPDPPGIPDPMPDELRLDPAEREARDEAEPMEGEAPSG